MEIWDTYLGSSIRREVLDENFVKFWDEDFGSLFRPCRRCVDVHRAEFDFLYVYCVVGTGCGSSSARLSLGLDFLWLISVLASLLHTSQPQSPVIGANLIRGGI